jgi:acyl-CoA reductase-like NAD-dependent aldehyde dehydrogenase
MASAALVTGNTVVLKPAEQSPACGQVIVESLLQAGAPPGAINLVTGFGDAGAALVRDPRVHTIAFTGSGAVGLEIVRTAAETPDGQTHVKRVVAEMGGKNCVIVDSDADLDEVVPNLIKSAFVYAGQKCSAAARVLAHDAVADTLIERLAGAVDVLQVGQADTFGTEVPPVIDDEAQKRVLDYIEIAERDGRIAAQRDLDLAPKGPGPSGPDPSGFFAPPTLAVDLPPDSPVLRDEIFGPVLTVERFKSIEAACDAVEASPFALTGGLFSRSPATIDYVIGRSPVGNLYVNRHITGAMVARQPFGGNRRSGIGAKAGGPECLSRLNRFVVLLIHAEPRDLVAVESHQPRRLRRHLDASTPASAEGARHDDELPDRRQITEVDSYRLPDACHQLPESTQFVGALEDAGPRTARARVVEHDIGREVRDDGAPVALVDRLQGLPCDFQPLLGQHGGPSISGSDGGRQPAT